MNAHGDRKTGFNRRRFLKWLVYSSPLLAAGDALLWEPEWVRVRTRKLSEGSPRHRFVHFSDIHHKGDRKYLEGVVARINAASPEFVCFTGDLVEDKEHLAEALEILGGIKSPVFGVPGNHDYWSGSDFSEIEHAFKRTGGDWLLERQARIAGADFLLTGTSCSQPLTLDPGSGLKNVLLMHYPAWADKLGSRRFDLMLAGHSHGGQVRIPFYGALMVPGGVGRYETGMYSTDSGSLHVNPGIGWFMFAIRFNCRPEITIFEV